MYEQRQSPACPVLAGEPMARLRSLVAALLVTSLAACAAESEEEVDSESDSLTDAILRPYLYTGKWTNFHNRAVGLLGESISDGQRRLRTEKQLAKARGLLKLAVMREWLLEDCLHDTNPGKIEIVDGPSSVSCDAAAAKVRTIDGTCNDLAEPTMGAAHVRFGRNAPPDKTFPRGEEILEPNPREISLKLFSRPTGTDGKPKVTTVPFLNMLAVPWIQFQNHDWFSHGDVVNTGDVFAIPLAADDPFRAQGMEILPVPKTQLRAKNVDGKPTFYNEVTHWWDGSQLYGSDLRTANDLRAKRDELLLGELAMTDGRLPLGADGVEKTGMNRNWWIGLSLMHHLFASEHNQIVAMLRRSHAQDSLRDELAETYPKLRDDDARYEQWLYDHARLINGAVMAKIHTVEWTPAVLFNPTLNLAMKANWYGLASAVRGGQLTTTSLADRWLKAARIFDPALNGLVGGERTLGPHDVPYALTEEFTSVYRLHSLLPEALHVRGDAGTVDVPTAETRLEKSHELSTRYSMPELLSSFGGQHPGTLTLHNYPRFLQDLSIPGFDRYDVGAVDILRDRERGVPRYNAFRESIHLKRLDSIDDLTTDAATRAELKSVYGSDRDAIDRVDLLVGTLAEGPTVRPEGFGFGETMFQIFLLMASRRLMADRFFTDQYNPATYTQEGLDWIDAASFKSVIVRNHPETADALANVDNAFLPWDGSAGRDAPTDFKGD